MKFKFTATDAITALLIVGLMVLRGMGRDGTVDALLLACGSLYLGYHFGKGNGKAP